MSEEEKVPARIVAAVAASLEKCCEDLGKKEKEIQQLKLLLDKRRIENK